MNAFIRRVLVFGLIAALCLTMPAMADVAKGAKGEDAMAVQRLLIRLGYLTGKADGDFGGGTEKAVKAFQAAEGMAQTGVVDDATRHLMNVRMLQSPFMYATGVVIPGYDEVTRNSNNELVNHALTILFEPEELPLKVESISWTDDYTELESAPIASDTPFELYEPDNETLYQGYMATKEGATIVSYYGVVVKDIALEQQEVEGKQVSLMLPDDPSLAGDQFVVLECGDYHLRINFKLVYVGNYENDLGWGVQYNGVKVKPIGESLEGDDTDAGGTGSDGVYVFDVDFLGQVQPQLQN